MGVKERPILFSAPMVRAILDGRKTQTRRVVKHHPSDDGNMCLVDYGDGWWPYRSDDSESPVVNGGDEIPYSCPYGQPGDRLWVRETWRVRGGQEYEYQRDRSQVMYRATHGEDGYPLGWESYDWRPSIYMPRWASRITLEITGVRVERLNEISDSGPSNDCAAEGVFHCGMLVPSYEQWHGDGFSSSEKWMYWKLWESINGPGSFDSRWVWVLEFRRIDA